jgi:hypothetical protein
MNEHEPQFGNRIRHLLNQGEPLDPSVSARLRAARELALARQKPEGAQGLVWAGGILGRLGGFSGLSLRLIVPLIALAIGLAAVYAWEQKQRAAEVEELDALVLTGELPIDAYLDRGFEAWLKKRDSF